MTWLEVDKDDEECIYEKKPERNGYFWDTHDDEYVRMPEDSIKKLIGRELTWSDEPVEI